MTSSGCGTSRVPETDVVDLGARALASNIAERAISSTEAVAAYVARAERLNPALNAIVADRFEQAATEAEAADRALARGGHAGPLHGVPVTVKETFDVAGLPTTGGLPRLAETAAAADAPLVSRLRGAGAIVLGKTNIPQLIWFNEADNPLYGRSNNPWHRDRATGGSSGGEAAAVAAGLSPLGLGTDAGGSIRLPAHCCGVHGLKPTAARLTTLGTFDELILAGNEGIRNQPGPLARTVADLWLALQVLVGGGDPSVPAVPLREPADVDVASLRIGVYGEDGTYAPGPATVRAVETAGAALAAAGATLVEFRPPHVSEIMQTFGRLVSADGGASLDALLADGPRDHRLVSSLKDAAQLGPISASAYFALVERRNALRRNFIDAMTTAGLDALVCPVSAMPAFPHGLSLEYETTQSYSAIFNLVGLPAGTVAATRVRPDEEHDPQAQPTDPPRSRVEQGSAGLPVGVQVAAGLWREDVVLAVMEVLEEAFRRTDDYPAIDMLAPA
jgi:fatty acid amide hydrolase